MNQNQLDPPAKNLIIVPGHAVYAGASAADAYFGGKWVGTYKGASGYRFDDEVPLYVRHVQRGINLAHDDPAALLMFSGGKTRKDTLNSEAGSYLALTEQLDWFGCRTEVLLRTRVEEFATDSFENLLFSIQLFVLLHPKQSYPRRVTVVGLRFKEARYLFHAETIVAKGIHGIPPFVFRYDGVNDVPDYVLAAGSRDGEELTFQQFRRWPLGSEGELLAKKQSRDPHGSYALRPYPR